MIETSLGVVSACLPTLRPLYGVYSLHSIVTSVRSLISRRNLTASHGSGSRSRRLDSMNGQSDSELQPSSDGYSDFGQNGPGMPDKTYIFSAGSCPLETLSEPSHGILVKKDVSLGHEAA
jgi:hypothetical protein